MMQPNNSVNAPTAVTVSRATADTSKIGFALAMRYTPAVTIVAAWMSADTGVGPSIASGNQACRGNWPDLLTAPSSNNNPMAVAAPVGIVSIPANTSL